MFLWIVIVEQHCRHPSGGPWFTGYGKGLFSLFNIDHKQNLSKWLLWKVAPQYCMNLPTSYALSKVYAWKMDYLYCRNSIDYLHYRLKRVSFPVPPASPFVTSLNEWRVFWLKGSSLRKPLYLQTQMHIYTLMNNEGYLLLVLEIMVDFGVPFIKPTSESVLCPDIFIAVQVKQSSEIVLLPNCNHKGMASDSENHFRLWTSG